MPQYVDFALGSFNSGPLLICNIFKYEIRSHKLRIRAIQQALAAAKLKITNKYKQISDKHIKK